MDEPTTARDDRAEPQCYQGLNEPLELALVFSFLGRWMGTGYGNGPLGPKPATGPTLAQSLCRIQSEGHTHNVTPPLAPSLPKAAAPAAQFNRITGANAGGLRQLPMRTRWTVRVAPFGRSAK